MAAEIRLPALGHTSDEMTIVEWYKKVGDRVEPGESLATIHASDERKAAEAAELLKKCYTLSQSPVEKAPFIKAVVS